MKFLPQKLGNLANHNNFRLKITLILGINLSQFCLLTYPVLLGEAKNTFFAKYNIPSFSVAWQSL